jgi:site-specific DNA-adenine methylase
VSKLELNDKVMNAAVMFVMSNSRMYGGNSDDIENTKGMDLGQLIGYSKLLDNVEIRNSDYKDVIGDEDSDKTLFLIDPPYYIKKVDSYYKCDCKYVYHREIADNIRKINGKFLLTYNISDYIKGLYDDFRRFEVDNGAYINELMITNIDLNEDDIRRIYKGIKTVKIV